MLEVVSGWWEVRWIWWMRQNFVAQFIKLWKHWLWGLWSGVVTKIWAHYIDQYRPQVLQFSVHLFDLLSMLLRCNDFTRIQKAVMNQTGSRPPVAMTFFGCKFGFGKCFGAASRCSHWADCHRLCEIHFSLHITVWSRNGLLCRIKRRWHFRMMIFFICSQPTRHPLIKLFHLSNLFQMWNNHTMVDIEFLGNFSCSCKRISFDDGSQFLLSTSDGWPLCSSSSRLSSPLHNLNWPRHCMFVSSSWARCIVDVVSCLHRFMIHFELK